MDQRSRQNELAPDLQRALDIEVGSAGVRQEVVYERVFASIETTYLRR